MRCSLTCLGNVITSFWNYCIYLDMVDGKHKLSWFFSPQSLLFTWGLKGAFLILINIDCNRKVRQILFHLYCIYTALSCIVILSTSLIISTSLLLGFFFFWPFSPTCTSLTYMHHFFIFIFFMLYKHLSAVCSLSLSCSYSPMCCSVLPAVRDCWKSTYWMCVFWL